jgi:hypothetical protein
VGSGALEVTMEAVMLRGSAPSGYGYGDGDGDGYGYGYGDGYGNLLKW